MAKPLVRRSWAPVGESVGDNMVVATPIVARHRPLTQRDHIASADAVGQTSLDPECYEAKAEAFPLDRAMMELVFDKTVTDERQLPDPRMSLVDANPSNLPPVRIIDADIDPPRRDDTMLTDAIEAAGSPAERRTFDGVTHQSFGIAVVAHVASAAQEYAVERLQADLSE